MPLLWWASIPCCCCHVLLCIAASAAAPATLTLLARRVDDPHPYFYRLTVDLRPNVGALVALKSSLGRQMSGEIRRLVKNDQQVLASDAEAAQLQPSDRLEVWLMGSGLPTRAATLCAHARFGPQGRRWRLEARRGAAGRPRLSSLTGSDATEN